MRKRFAIIPGRSIGPFQLKKTRSEIEALGIKPSMEHRDGRGTYYPLVAMSEQELARESFPRPGVNVCYEQDGRCRKIEAIFAYDDSPPVFTLFGELVNGMTLKRAGAIFNSLSADTRYGYASVRSAAAGIKASMYEASDEHIMSIVISPPNEGDN